MTAWTETQVITKLSPRPVAATVSRLTGTPVMDAAPLAALDLPLKVLIWADGIRTNVTYYSPTAIAARYELSNGLAANLAGIDVLTDALITS